jgi:hypothetical protein
MRREADRSEPDEAAVYGGDVVRLIRDLPEAATPEVVWFLAAVAARIARRTGGIS